MLAAKRSAGVAPEVNLRNSLHISEESTLVLKLRAEATRSPKQGYHWPHKKDLYPLKNIFKKKTRSDKLKRCISAERTIFSRFSLMLIKLLSVLMKLLSMFLCVCVCSVFCVTCAVTMTLRKVLYQCKKDIYTSYHYRSGTVYSKTFVGPFFLQIKWKYELNYVL